jgi:hypothetical protein
MVVVQKIDLFGFQWLNPMVEQVSNVIFPIQMAVWGASPAFQPNPFVLR